jgi:23S rRNA (guanosine2251-2'-O)-methyltransferase
MSELLYGRHAVYEALSANRRRIYRLWLEEGKGKGEIIGQIEGLANEAKLPLRRIKGGIFDKLTGKGVNAQGVALEVDGYPYVALQDCLDLAADRDDAPLLLLLDHLQDPQNLGTLMRTAETMGVHGIVIPDRRAAAITPAVSNASAGAVERLLVAQVTNLNRTIDDLKQAGVWVAGLDGDPAVPPLAAANLDGPMAIVVGSESSGLSRLTREKCDFLVRLPMYGEIESLNAAIAGSIVLYATRQARTT